MRIEAAKQQNEIWIAASEKLSRSATAIIILKIAATGGDELLQRYKFS